MSRSEADLEREVIAWAAEVGGYALKLKDEERGWPDRTIWLPDGQVIVPELKRPRGGRASYMQRVWIERLQKLGHRSGFCKTLEEVLDL